MIPTYRGILFDLDGTLVDSLELILASYHHTMKEHLGGTRPDEEWLRTMGQPLKVQLANFANSPAQLDAMFRTYVDHNQAVHDDLIRPFPGMREAVSALRGAGYRLAVVTSKIREHAIRELESCGLADQFETLISADDVEHPKPDPEPVLEALSNLRLSATQALFVGDSLFDMLAARAAGVHSAAALWGPFSRRQLAAGKPDFWLSNIASLLVLLDVGREAPRG